MTQWRPWLSEKTDHKGLNEAVSKWSRNYHIYPKKRLLLHSIKKLDEIRKRYARNINRRSTDSDESDSATETDSYEPRKSAKKADSDKESEIKSVKGIANMRIDID